ncbi:MAG: hypothetical protein J5497_02525, partial [Selenomonadaceae bacterium]|nr:hypothetical protein [Selenomonadaceae bacterium]
KKTDALDGNTEHYPQQEVTFYSSKNVTLMLDDWKVVEVSGVTGSVSGLIDATVVATEPVTVNGKSMDITDGDDNFGVVVEDGSVTKATTVTGGDATVNVEDGVIETDGNGKINIGGKDYVINDSESSTTIYTDDSGNLGAIDDLDGWIEATDGNTNITVNGGAIETKGTSSPVTISAGASGVMGVDGLDSGDTVNGDLDNAEVHLPGSSGSASLTVNGKTYTTFGDPDGVTVQGNNNIYGLDEGSTLKVSEEGDYTVNSAHLHVRPIDDVVGVADGEWAIIPSRDETTLLIRKLTAINHEDDDFNIEDLTHRPHNHSVVGSEANPWTKEDTDAILGANSTVNLNMPLEVWLDNNDIAAQVVDVSKTARAKKIHLMDGDQEVKLNDTGKNLVHVMSVASGNKNVTLGDGGDVAIVDMAADGGKVTIIGGTGDDSIIVRDNAPTTVDLSAGGKDMVLAFAESNSRISLEGYDATTGAAIRVEEWKSSVMAEAIENRIVDFDDGVVIVQSDEGKSRVDIDSSADGTNDGWFVNLLSYKKDPEDKQLVGFTGTDGGSIDASNFDKPAILIGNMFDEKAHGSTITGTDSHDTIYGGAGDSINTGDGKDLVKLFE